MNSHRAWSLCFTAGLLAVPLLSSAADKSDWYRTDPLARYLSQLTPTELSKFEGSDLVDVRPVVLPTPKNIVGVNDYYDWPIGTMIGHTLIVLYDRRGFHFGGTGQHEDSNSGIRMLVRSEDGGKTWSEPYDILQLPGWAHSPFKAWGGGFGVKGDSVFLALDQGLYRSDDHGKTWHLTFDHPAFKNLPAGICSAAMRITFSAEHGMTLWTTRGWKEHRGHNPDYGTYMCAVSSKDEGQTWTFQEQKLPEGITLSEICPVQYPDSLAFFLRNGISNVHYAQGYSATGWFPFRFDLTNVVAGVPVDTPDVNYNPVTRRLEAAVTLRNGEDAGPAGGNKLNLYSMSPQEMKAGSTQWRYDGTLVRYKDTFAHRSDGMNPVGTIMDTETNLQYIYVWAGDQVGQAGIFQYTRSLDTPAVSAYLKKFYLDHPVGPGALGTTPSASTH